MGANVPSEWQDSPRVLGEAGGSWGSHIVELQATSAQEANRTLLSAHQPSTQPSPHLAAMLSGLQPSEQWPHTASGQTTSGQ